MTQHTPIAIVTGANRGIGLEVVRQLAQRGMHVVLGSRDREKGETAARSLPHERGTVQPYQLDVTDQQSIDRLAREITAQFGQLDILVNNAAILYDTWQQATTADLKTVHTALETNVFGAWRMCQAFLPLLRKSRAARIVNVSSESGSLAQMSGETPAYSVSKVALNALTRMFAAELAGKRHPCEFHLSRLGRDRYGRAGRTTCGTRSGRHHMGGYTPRQWADRWLL